MSSGAHSRGWFRPGYGPHPEELAKQASRRMDAKQGLAAILRDARGRAPQDEVGILHRLFRAMTTESVARSLSTNYLGFNFKQPPSTHSVIAGHSRPKDGVASARLCPAIHLLRKMVSRRLMDARVI